MDVVKRTLGIDVSWYDDDHATPQRPDFVKAHAAGAEFVFVKASQGLAPDPDFATLWPAAKEAGLLRGAYHFLTWNTSPEFQASNFYTYLKNDPGELPPVVDFEWWSTVPPTAFDKLYCFLEMLKQLSKKTPIIYTGPSFWQTYGKKDLYWKQYGLWIAHYGVDTPTVPVPWSFWQFWQHSSHGDGARFGMESKSVDLDYFNGTLDELRAYVGQPAPAPQATWAQAITAWARRQGYDGPEPE
jgi:lysozyme